MLGRRTSVVRTGTAFTGGSGDHLDLWGYNSRNELTSSARYADTDPNNPSDPNHALDRAYAYDPIGNRTDYTEGTSAAVYYCANNLNQYTTTDDTTSCPPASPTESFGYDADGNLTEDDSFEYTWDAENRLIRVEPAEDDPNELTGEDKKLVFKYDYMGRRAEKAVYSWDPNATDWESDPELRRLFVYHEWLPLIELDATDPNDVTILRKYTWGLDLSGNSIEPAGGIGGLLATRDVDEAKSYVYFYDANGNVGQLVNRSGGAIEAKYEYDAYGKNLLAPNDPNESGPYATDNPFRFSTKCRDDETALGYWGYRYHSPRLGRWINRDPISEPGAALMRRIAPGRALVPRESAHRPNLYVFVRSSPANIVDPQGMFPLELMNQGLRLASLFLCPYPPTLGSPAGGTSSEDTWTTPPEIDIWGPWTRWLIAREERAYRVSPTSTWGEFVSGLKTTTSLESEADSRIVWELAQACRCRGNIKTVMASGGPMTASTLHTEWAEGSGGTGALRPLRAFLNINGLHMIYDATCNIRDCCTHCTATCLVDYDVYDSFHFDLIRSRADHSTGRVWRNSLGASVSRRRRVF